MEQNRLLPVLRNAKIRVPPSEGRLSELRLPHPSSNFFRHTKFYTAVSGVPILVQSDP